MLRRARRGKGTKPRVKALGCFMFSLEVPSHFDAASGDRSAVAGRGPDGRFCSRYRVSREKRWTVVPSPSQMQWVRLGYSIMVNGRLAATRALIRRAVPG